MSPQVFAETQLEISIKGLAEETVHKTPQVKKDYESSQEKNDKNHEKKLKLTTFFDDLDL